MLSVSVFILFTCSAQANAKEPMDDLVDQLVDQLVGKVAMPSATLPGILRGANPSQSMLLQHLPRTMPNSFLGSGHGLTKGQSSVATKATMWDKDMKFNYQKVDFDYKEISASEVEGLMDKGWTVLDVRNAEQIARAEMKGTVEVPLYVQKNDLSSPLGLYQEAGAFALGGWWMGGRPMKENHDFVNEVEQQISKQSPGIIVVCQTGMRSKQALKELHLAGFTHLAMLKGGFNSVKRGELPCVDDEVCDLDLANSGALAGMLHWRTN